MPYHRWQGDDLLLFCHLQPKASADGFAGEHGDRLKIRITAPPVDGKANSHLLRFLAEQFGVPASHVTLQNGESSRQKTVLIRAPRQLPPALALPRP
jgi:uncharacterized protein (TIGR00251 family)